MEFRDQFAPKKLDDVVFASDDVEVSVRRYEAGVTREHLLLSGPPGTGKSTIAAIVASHITGGSVGADNDVMVVNGSKARGIADAEKWAVFAGTFGLGPTSRRALIIEEADGITEAARGAMKGIMDDYGDNTTFIFTTNDRAKMLPAICSRCTELEIYAAKAERWLKRAKEILVATNTPVPDDHHLLAVLEEYVSDNRAVMRGLQRLSEQIRSKAA